MGNDKATATSTRIPVSVDKDTHAALKAYSGLTNVPVTKVLAEAVKDWMATVGAARLESLSEQTKAGRNLLQFPGGITPAEVKAELATAN